MAYLILSERLEKAEVYKTENVAHSHLKIFQSVDDNAEIFEIPSKLLTLKFWRSIKGIDAG